VNEIIASSKNYSELNENICLKFKNFFMTEMQTSLQEGAKELIDRIENYIIENYNKNITYKTFYEMFGYNQIYITNLYKNEKGISPSKFITKLRIQKARELINLNPDIPLKEVAKMVGYDDPLYFSKVFKNFTGISPGKYISNHINYHENEP
jgi:YesN/AraC family two-component response regulator